MAVVKVPRRVTIDSAFAAFEKGLGTKYQVRRVRGARDADFSVGRSKFWTITIKVKPGSDSTEFVFRPGMASLLARFLLITILGAVVVFIWYLSARPTLKPIENEVCSFINSTPDFQ